MNKPLPVRVFFQKAIENGGDAVAAVVTVGVLADWLPAILAGFGIGWFVLRFINFFRVNFLEKDPWGMG